MIIIIIIIIYRGSRTRAFVRMHVSGATEHTTVNCGEESKTDIYSNARYMRVYVGYAANVNRVWCALVCFSEP